jgi:hypothetical protein
MKEETAEQAAARKAADAERKRDERARKKEQLQQTAEQAKASAVTTYHEYWKGERAKLPEAERTTLEERQSDVWSLRELMALHLHGQQAELELPDVIELVQEEVTAHGTVEMIVLVIERFWTEDERDFRERAVRAFGKPTEVLMRYGYLTALDSKTVYDFQQKFMKPKSNPTSFGNGYVAMQCGCGGCISVPTSIAQRYRELGITFLCGRCRDLENRSRAVATGVKTEFGQPQSIIHDNFGRLRDQ